MDRLITEVEYKREMNRNYMVMLPDTDGNERYAIRMFTDNQIPGFLPFHEKRTNGERRYYYDITSKQPLKRILECRNLTGEELEQLISALLFSLRQVERFLLNESCISLKPDYIYIDPDTFKCFFCYIPGKWTDFSQSLCELSQCLLDHINHRDGDAVVLAFAFFKECRKENSGVEDIERCLEKRTGRESEEFSKEGHGERINFNRVQGRLGGTKTADVKENVKSDDNEKSGGERSIPGRVKEEEKDTVPYEQTDMGERGRTHVLRMILIAAMAAFPVIAVAVWGLQGLVQYKWILGASEVMLGTILFMISSVSSGIKRADKSGDEKEQKEEPWEVYFREEDDIEKPEREEELFQTGEEEMQTVLLSARPAAQEYRRLVSVTGNLEIPIGYFPFLLGKSKEMADFCLNEPGVSRLHVKLEKSSGGYFITDLNSTNGTRVNGKLLEANETCPLPLDSEVEIASGRFWFR